MNNDLHHIQHLVEQRGITSLYHFTNIRNLESILTNGLLSRIQLKESAYHTTDNQRLDDHLDHISVSITAPNHNMFYKKRQEKPSAIWCVIELDPSLLYRKQCLYFHTNAARSEFRTIAENNLSSPLAFEDMFGGQRHTNTPANNQAEVLIKERISTQFIKTINLEQMTHLQIAYPAISITNENPIKPFHNPNTSHITIQQTPELFQNHPQLNSIITRLETRLNPPPTFFQ